jgi:hypothetical protein
MVEYDDVGAHQSDPLAVRSVRLSHRLKPAIVAANGAIGVEV